MKHSIRKDFTMKFLTASMAVLLGTSFLFAQADGSTAKDQAGTTMKMHGKVVSVDVKANTIIVETERTVDTLAVASGAKIMLGMMELSKEITLNDIQNGVSVSITWELIDGNKTATKIVVNSAADAKWKKGI
jgi:hypothetical protein